MVPTHAELQWNVPLIIRGRDYTELRGRRPTAHDILRSTRKSAHMTALEERPIDDLIEWLKTLEAVTPRKRR